MSARALPAGTVVHRRYRIQRTLGEGGFGVTYLVTDLKEGQTVAMKEYMPSDIASRRSGSVEVTPLPQHKESYERFRTRFLEEARIIYQYRGHPNIVRVMHLFYENNTAYYVMEFVKGMDLGKLLERNGQRLPWQTLRPIFSQVVTALAEVHRSGIIHCDISPDNIFILQGGQVKLIDFGAAKSVMKGQSSVILLKRGYAPPEQLSANGQIGPWTDVYALAVTMYRCVTGKLPPNAEDRMMVDRTVWPSQLGVAPSDQWEQALRGAMALRPDQRYQDAEQFWQDLNRQTAAAVPAVVGRTGGYAGQRIPIQGEVLFGTDRSRCQILFPEGTPGIGRVHMRIWADEQGLMVMDMASGYTTQVATGSQGRALTPGLAYPLPVGATVIIGGQSFQINAESR